jgi:hypothetical protein
MLLIKYADRVLRVADFMVNAYYFSKAVDFLSAQFKKVPHISVSLTDNFMPYTSCNKRPEISQCYRAAATF